MVNSFIKSELDYISDCDDNEDLQPTKFKREIRRFISFLSENINQDAVNLRAEFWHFNVYLQENEDKGNKYNN